MIETKRRGARPHLRFTTLASFRLAEIAHCGCVTDQGFMRRSSRIGDAAADKQMATTKDVGGNRNPAACTPLRPVRQRSRRAVSRRSGSVRKTQKAYVRPPTSSRRLTRCARDAASCPKRTCFISWLGSYRPPRSCRRCGATQPVYTFLVSRAVPSSSRIAGPRRVPSHPS